MAYWVSDSIILYLSFKNVGGATDSPVKWDEPPAAPLPSESLAT